MTGASNAPANWYPDPEDATQLRYWDGTQWTDRRTPAVAADATHAEEPPATAGAQGFTEPPKRSRGGIFGAKKDLEAELAELRALVDGFGYAERAALDAAIAQLRTEQTRLGGEVVSKRAELAQLEAGMVKARDQEMLQEIGIYAYHHRIEDASAYKERLDSVRRRIKEMSKRDGGAVQATTDWSVNNSAAQGRKMVNEISKLLLRAYNGEADVLVNKMKPFRLDASIDQLNKARATISKLGATMYIRITDDYHQLRVEELTLTADFLAKKEAEKEAEREERERLREEAKARQEYEAEKAKLRKEQAHYLSALERLRAGGSPEEIAAAEQKLAEIGEAIQGVEEREANIRTGYVYVISNFGSFGENVVKIGLTRRLDPIDRVRELGDASVPFRYDVHALIFSQDAVTLENRLHEAFKDRRVNMVNHRREFFYATPKEVEAVLTASDGSLLEFVEEPEADEWRQSVNARHEAPSQTPPAEPTVVAAPLPTPGATEPPPPPLPA
jgi:hypothetical protein